MDPALLDPGGRLDRGTLGRLLPGTGSVCYLVIFDPALSDRDPGGRLKTDRFSPSARYCWAVDDHAKTLVARTLTLEDI